ncbi:MAG TPA: serine/threonine-protein kinase [Polyangia bacterium]|nr:serine/threonine-protein kinase [Polyangia bacterium]
MTATPERLGRYRVVRPLARGGMAELFLARSSGIQGFEKLVVVKRVLPELARDADYVGMFLDEARLAARMHHSNLVQVYDIGEADGLPFYAMEYLDGHDVREIIRALQARREKLPIEHALLITIGVAAALHYAHEMKDEEGRTLGIVHRDVSPQNVAVTFDGGVKLFDFGVAKAKRRSTETRHGTLKGKIQYMSPEQCRGDEVDRRSDVFSVAILMWELMTGRRLYGGNSDFGVMKSIAESDAPKPSLVWPECPPELEEIVMRGLRREKQGRFATMEELQLALEAYARESRLAVSGVGMGKHLRKLFAPIVAKVADSEKFTLYDAAKLVPGDADLGGATVFDGVFSQAYAAISIGGGAVVDGDAAEVADDDRGRHTRAVARRVVARRSRRGTIPLVVGLLTVAAGGGAAWQLLHRAGKASRPAHPERAPAPAATNAPVVTPTAAPTNAPTVDEPKPAPATATNAAATPQPDEPVAEGAPTTTIIHEPKSNAHAGKHHLSKAARAKAATRPAATTKPRKPTIDLDAPLPPR